MEFTSLFLILVFLSPLTKVEPVISSAAIGNNILSSHSSVSLSYEKLSDEENRKDLFIGEGFQEIVENDNKDKELKRIRRFNIMDLFVGNGIFSQLPQLLINIFSFFSSLFPSNDSESESDDVEAPAPSPAPAQSQVIE